ncbi:hypothetical protein COO60DRAFT_558857 [Scenedesmus sp. NREL 46B-D3]|nr:hypothetical protein COO60DRAFT_558857 [Scenedesmus sp. NREL 46B-D3]
MQALEGLVLRHLAGKPHLTLMQLQRGIQAVSCLESQFQLAAIGVLLRGGCWLAAMQVAYADFAVLSEVLLEMRHMLATCLQLDSRLSAAIWIWHSVDRDLFLRAFRGHGVVSHYQQLRRQHYRLRQLQQPGQRQQHAAAVQQQGTVSGKLWAAAWQASSSAASSAASSGTGVVGAAHPQLAMAEQQLLLAVVDNYLADVTAALQEQQQHAAAAISATAGALFPVLEVCEDAADSVMRWAALPGRVVAVAGAEQVVTVQR